MDTLTIQKTGVSTNSKIFIPSSKSYIHRYLLSALLADGESVIENVSFSKDIEATLSCIRNLGALVFADGSTIRIKGGIRRLKEASLYCNESASTLRFVIPIATLFADSIEYRGAQSLLERPLGVYFDIFRKNQMPFEFEKGKFLRLSGAFSSREYVIDGSVSSQFVTGLLFTLPAMDFDSVIVIDGKLESKPYVDITLEVLKNSGIEIVNNDYKSFEIKGSQKYKSGRFFAQGDYSQAAFFLAAGCFGGGIECINMEHMSLQGDKAIVDILKKMGAVICDTPNGFRIEKSALKAIGEIDATDFPDIVPPLSVVCSVADGTTVIKGIERLRIKECARVLATVDVLTKLGADIKEEQNAIVIKGKPMLKGGTVSSYNDHRIAMSASVAALMCEEAVTIENPMSINKSYPKFYDDLHSTGTVKYV